MIDVGFAVLHNALFLGGTNLGQKLDTHHRPDLKMVYDRAEKELIVTFRGKTSYVPSTNVASYQPGPADDRKILQSATLSTLGSSRNAQVESPMSHVHAGYGHGKTGQKSIKS